MPMIRRQALLIKKYTFKKKKQAITIRKPVHQINLSSKKL
jgi:hypothetical protein